MSPFFTDWSILRLLSHEKGQFRSLLPVYMYGLLHEQARRFGYQSRQDVATVSCPIRTTRRVPQEKFPRKPFNKSFIDKVCLVNMA